MGRTIQRKTDLLQGTLDLLVLQVVKAGPLHGWGIAQRIQLLSKDLLRVEEGSIYPALYRMERRGWIRARWGQSANNRRARFYALTEEGRKQLVLESDDWKRVCIAIAAVLRSA